MPFDPARQQLPDVTVLSPTPPERGEGPRQTRVEIEIIERQREQLPTYGLGFVLFWVLLFALIALAR